jgi:predicted nucleotidyltransferase
MASPSKEDSILELIFGSSPLKHWHFEELLKESGLSRGALDKWLKRYIASGILIKVRERGRYPYFTCGEDNPIYTLKKKQYLLNKLYDSGLFSDILKAKLIKTAILFGSAAKGDWYKGSDIDIFMLGNPEGFDRIKFEKGLRRDIELHMFESEEELKEVKSGMIKNVLNGYLIKGSKLEIAELIL